jgi:hypothetical protein
MTQVQTPETSPVLGLQTSHRYIIQPFDMNSRLSQITGSGLETISF